MHKTRVIVAGSRIFNDVDFIYDSLDELLEGLEDIEIVSGMAPGVDSIAVNYAKDRFLPLAEFPADWTNFKRAAGPIRNEQMAKYATHLVAYSKDNSIGTANMISNGNKYNLIIKIIII